MVRTSYAFLIGTVAVFMTAIIAFLGGWFLAQSIGTTSLGTIVTTTRTEPGAASETSAEVADAFGVFWEAWEIVDRDFYHTEPLDRQQMVYGAIRGMLASLQDDYTVFQEPEAAERSRESLEGRFEGIGIYMRMDAGAVFVDRPIKGSPAMDAGLQSDDEIVAVDGEAVFDLIHGLDDGQAMDEVAKRIRGPKGTPVVLTIRRLPDEAPFDVEITRDEVPLISVHYEMIDRVAYIQLTEFKATTTEELDEALNELLPQQPTGIVLDVRNNPGGFLTTSQEVLGRFYDGVALYERLSDGSDKEFPTISGDIQVYDLPMVVLLNGRSASASEIVAGALRDERPNTTLLGETSFGKGSVQNIHQLSDSSSIRVTIAHWFTPDMHEINEIGITPEYVVPASQDPEYALECVAETRPPEGQELCTDAQLVWGLRLLTSDQEPPPVTPTPGAWLPLPDLLAPAS